MKCTDCVLWYINEGEDWPCCHADPNWSAPCEYEEDIEEDEDPFNENDPYVVTDPMAFY